MDYEKDERDMPDEPKSKERRCPSHDVLLEYDIETGLHICPECGYCE